MQAKLDTQASKYLLVTPDGKWFEILDVETAADFFDTTPGCLLLAWGVNEILVHEEDEDETAN